MIKIDFVCADDWEGIYVDGRLVVERHSIDFYYGMRSILVHANSSIIEMSFTTHYVSQDWMDEHCDLPVDFSDIPDDAFLNEDN